MKTKFAALSIFVLLSITVLVTNTPSATANTLDDCPTELFISEYIEGSSNNKAVEIFNGTGVPVNLTGYRLTLYSNGSTAPGNDFDFSGTLNAGDVFVVANPNADPAILAVADATDDVTYYDGNDALVLTYNGVVVDSMGQVGDDSSWGAEVTLVRKPSIIAGDVISDDPFNPTLEWDSYAQDTFDYLGDHTIDPCDLSELLVSKAGPGSVGLGQLFSYTLTVANQTTDTLTSLTVSDTLPLSLTYSSSTPPGAWYPLTHTLVWTASSLAGGDSLSYTIAVTAPNTTTVVTNSQYVAWATEWPTPTGGPPVATAVVEPGGLTSIYDIQYTTDPSGDSPLLGQVVTTTGVVYAVYGDGFAVAEASGPWHGLYVYYPSGAMPQIGDEVQVTGEVQEYYGMTELGNYATYLVLSSGHTPYPQSDVQTVEIATGAGTAESYEGVLVATHNVTVTNPDLGYGEWEITDSSGVGARVDDWASYSYTPAQDDALYLVRGMLNYSFGDFKIEPRDDDDIVQAPPAGLLLSKTAPYAVAAEAEMTYTLEVQNWTGITLTNVIVTDAVPANATFARALDGGVLAGDKVSWTVPSLPHQDSLNRRFVVTATDQVGTVISNSQYAVRATEWPTPTLGDPVLTTIGNYTPIYLIQGTGFRSPFEGQTVKTVGAIGGFFEGNYPDGGGFDGFFIQDPVGDGLTSTSDGLFVQYDLTSLELGDLVTVTGQVQEFSEWDEANCAGSACQTQILADDVQVGSTGNPPLTVLDPPGDPAQAALYWEALEGMLVSLPSTATVVGPTSYGTVMAVRGDLGIERVMRTGPYEGMPVGVRHYEFRGDIGGADAPDLIVGSTITNADGPLAFSYGNYLVTTQAGDPWQVVYEQPPASPVPQWPSAGNDEFSLVSFNTYNFDGEEGASKLQKITSTLQALGYPTVLGLQEIATLSTCVDINGRTVTGVMDELITSLQSQGYTYEYAASHPDVGCHGVALLWRTDRVSDVTWSTQYQGCSTYGSSSAETYDDYCPVEDEYPLFSRRPVVLTGTVDLAGDDMQVVVIANHFKSKLGGTSADLRRLGQGQLINDLVSDLVAAGSTHVAVLGDLNDFEDAPPLEAIYAGGTVTNTWYTHPLEERYSYIYNGVSQILDHILTTPSLYTHLIEMDALHLNADYPYGYSEDGNVVWRTSDHEPVAATFTHVPQPALAITKTVEPTLDVPLGGVVTYTIVLSNNGDGPAHDTVMTDRLPLGVSFGDWLDQGSALLPDPPGDTIIWGPHTVPAGDSLTLRFTATVTTSATYYGQPITNTAYYSHTSGSGSDSAAFVVASEPVTGPNLNLSKTAHPDTDVAYHGEVTYTVTLNNSGTGAALGVTLTDSLPAEVTFARWLAQPAGADVVSDVVTWSGTVSGSSAIVFTFIVTHVGDYGDTVTNTAEYGYGQESSTASASFSVQGAGPTPQLSVDKQVSPAANVPLSSTVVYTISLSNSGDAAALGVVLTDVLPAEVSFGGWLVQNGADETDGTITWSGGISPTMDATLVFSATVVSGDPGADVSNVAQYASDNAGSGSDEAVFGIESEVSYTIYLPIVLKN